MEWIQGPCKLQQFWHATLCIKYRKKLLSENNKIRYFKYICSELGKRYQFTFDTIGTDGDRIHIFVGAAPKISYWKCHPKLLGSVKKFLKKKEKNLKSFGS